MTESGERVVADGMQIGILGPIQVVDRGRRLILGGLRQRAVLAYLVIHLNEVVSSERLIDQLWGDKPPRSVRNVLRTYISHLRKLLDVGQRGPRLLTHGGGYELTADQELVDARRFERLLERGRTALRLGDLDDAEATLAEGLQLWRGAALADFAFEPFAQLEIGRLQELHLVASEERFEAALGLGRHAELIPDLEATVNNHPLRERLTSQLMLALYRSDRQAEALRAYQRLRRRLSEDLGIEPAPALRRLEETMLQQDPQLEWIGPEPELGGRQREHADASLDPVPGRDATNVVILFTDLVSSTDLLIKIGDEPFGQAIENHLDLLAACVVAHDGKQVKNLGDGIMAVFPRAADAVDCAVNIQQALTLLAEQPGERELPVRVGISIGDPVRTNGDYLGTAVVEASRLCQAAAGGQILLAGSVRAELARRHRAVLRSIGSRHLKGLAAAIDIWEVGWVPTTDTSVIPAVTEVVMRNLPRTVQAPDGLVGREVQRNGLLETWSAVLQGQSRVALLGGDPGVGKTSLALSIAGEVYQSGGHVLIGSCTPDIRMDYQPFVEALGRLVESLPLSWLRAHVGPEIGELGRVLPVLTRRLPRLPPPRDAEPETERYLLCEAVAALLSALSAAMPILVVLDDIHWANRATLAMLRHLTRSLKTERVFIVGTFRDGEVSDELGDLLADFRNLPTVARVKLAGLTPAEVANLIELEAPGQLALADRLTVAWAIHADTRGNAFFTREIVRHLVETGGLNRIEGSHRSALADLPESVLEVIDRRVSRLSPTARDTLVAASVIGPSFTVELVEQAAGLTEEFVLDSIDVAMAAHLVIEVPGQHDCYAFAHSLVRTALYQSLATSRRRRIHRRVGEALEAAGSADDRGTLAYHFAEAASGADIAKAVSLCYDAGMHALEHGSYDEAANLLQRAVDLAARGVALPTSNLLALALASGRALNQVGSVGLARERFLQAAQLARATDDMEQLAVAAAGFATVVDWRDRDSVQLALDLCDEAIRVGAAVSNQQRAVVLSLSARWLRLLGESEQAVQRTATAWSVAEATGDTELVATILSNRYWTLYGPSNTVERLEVATRLLELGQEAERADTVLQGREWRLRDLLELGRVTEAKAEEAAMSALAGQLRHPQYLWYGAAYQAMRATVDGRFDEAERLIDDARSAGRGLRSRRPARRRELRSAGPSESVAELQTYMLRWYQGRLSEFRQSLEVLSRQDPTDDGWRSALALIYSEEGLPEEASETLSTLAVAGFDDLSPTVEYLPKLAAVAATIAFTRDRQAAAELYGILLPYADRDCTNLEFAYFGSAAHWLGVLAATIGNRDDAELHFQNAIDRHRQLSSPVWVALTEQAWAQMLADEPGRPDQSRIDGLVQSSLRTASTLGMRQVEKRLLEL